MSTLFNFLLFVGVFYLILQVPEPGNRRANRTQGAAGAAESSRKVA